jgi:hypothetical protein
MTYRSAFVKWLGSAGLVMATAGCPGGDDGDSGGESGPQPTTAVDTGSSSGGGESTATPPGTGTDEESTADPDTSGGVTCNPPCEAGQQCIDGACFDMPGDSTTGEPPMECFTPVEIQAPNPDCAPCLQANCCDQLQGCFGDETTMGETECLQLNNCIVMECMGVQPAEIQACIDKNCAEFSGSFNDWVAYQMCAGMNCLADCS